MALTNKSKIRQMTDAELVDFFVNKVLGWPWCDDKAPVDPISKDCLKNDGNCLQCCREWLYQAYQENFKVEDN